MTKFRVILPRGPKPILASYELTAAELLKTYFESDIEFIERNNRKTPDFKIGDLYWELKSPTGKGKFNVQHQLKAAAKQSENVIFDARRSKMHIVKIRGGIQHFLRHSKAIKRIILIEKTGKIVELLG